MLRRGSPEREQLIAFGQGLFRALLADAEVRACYERTVSAMLADEDRGLRLWLIVEEPALQAIPWEFLHDGERFLTVSNRTPLVRYIELPRPIRPLAVEPPLRILVVIAGPRDQAPLSVESEKDKIEEALTRVKAHVQVEYLEHAAYLAFQRKLVEAYALEKPIHILHFIGHGEYDAAQREGYLLFEDEAGYSERFSGDKIGAVLGDHPSIRLAVLNACEGAAGGAESPFASAAAALVRAGVPAVVAMQFPISDRAAILFSGFFYHALGYGYPVDAALGSARQAIYAIEDTIEFGTPVLFMRAREGRIFEVDLARVPAPPAPPPPPERREATPGLVQTRINPVDGAEMVYVPAGEFIMGSGDRDSTAWYDEKLQHTVYLDAFWIYKTAVTNAQYRKCVEAGACAPPHDTRYYDDPAYADHPVVYVDWPQAKAYCQWAGGRLPTEAEWEKAARGTDGRIWPWGNEWDENKANTEEAGPGSTTAVGSYPKGASPYGALDMAGNVWEWCSSLHRPYPYYAIDGREDLKAGGPRVLRGGSFHDYHQSVRCACRLGDDPSRRNDLIGFRIVLSHPPSEL